MPIYEYYCPICDGRFSHLARRFDEPPPPCPGCGARQGQKLISAAVRGRSEAERRADFEARSWEVDREDPREMARFLQKAGSLADEVAPVDREVFREIVARRAEGAGDQDLEDVVDAIPFPRQTFTGSGTSPHEHDHPHPEHDHPHHDHGHARGKAPAKRSPRRARDMGWG